MSGKQLSLWPEEWKHGDLVTLKQVGGKVKGTLRYIGPRWLGEETPIVIDGEDGQVHCGQWKNLESATE